LIDTFSSCISSVFPLYFVVYLNSIVEMRLGVDELNVSLGCKKSTIIYLLTPSILWYGMEGVRQLAVGEWSQTRLWISWKQYIYPNHYNNDRSRRWWYALWWERNSLKALERHVKMVGMEKVSPWVPTSIKSFNILPWRKSQKGISLHQTWMFHFLATIFLLSYLTQYTTDWMYSIPSPYTVLLG
jgi:hypothetical protein